MSNILYLHGFASQPNSTKGAFFARQFQQLGATVHQPDLNEGDFTNLTLTRALKLIDKTAQEIQPSLVIGSSLGGYLAALYGSMRPEFAPALVLMAPAFGFPKRWPERLGEEKMTEWREKGSIPTYHYGAGHMLEIGYGLYQDALWFDENPEIQQPTLILHGRRDDEVPAELSVEFAWGKPNVRLELLDSDHGLTDQLDLLWRETSGFYRQIETPAKHRA